LLDAWIVLKITLVLLSLKACPDAIQHTNVSVRENWVQHLTRNTMNCMYIH